MQRFGSTFSKQGLYTRTILSESPMGYPPALLRDLQPRHPDRMVQVTAAEWNSITKPGFLHHPPKKKSARSAGYDFLSANRTNSGKPFGYCLWGFKRTPSISISIDIYQDKFINHPLWVLVHPPVPSTNHALTVGPTGG